MQSIQKNADLFSLPKDLAQYCTRFFLYKKLRFIRQVFYYYVNKASKIFKVKIWT